MVVKREVRFSNAKLRKASYTVNQLVSTLKGGSEKTKADTRTILIKAIKDLQSDGYFLDDIKHLKEKHINSLVSTWMSEGKSPATVKNYMSKLRLTAKLIDKVSIVKRTNDEYKIPRRCYLSKQNKAINSIDLSGVNDPHIKLSMEAQKLFGLRREESLKLIPSQAYQGNVLKLQGSWTKGGIERQVPITNENQRDFLKRAIAFVGEGNSLIPKDRTNKSQINCYKSEARRLGFRNLHGLRHAYAQQRYRELSLALSGKVLECPKCGGKPQKQMTKQERLLDHKIRKIISENLGHSRIEILKQYCG